MPTEDGYSSRHLVLSHFGTYMCSNVETNLSWTCLVSGILSLEHPSVLLFCSKQNRESTKGYLRWKSSKDMTSSRNLVSTIWAQASPKTEGRNQVSGRVSVGVPYRHATPVANAPWKPLMMRWRSKSLWRSWNSRKVSYFNHLVSDTAVGVESPRGHM